MFEPIGDKSRRALAVELFQQYQPGDVIPYEIIGQHVGQVDRDGIQNTVNKAKKSLLIEADMALIAVPGIGYRIAKASEHIEVAGTHQSKALRSVRRGADTVTHVDFNQLTPAERALAQATGRALSAQADMLRRHEDRLKKHDQAFDLTSRRQDNAEERLAEVEKRLGIEDRTVANP